jgi:hypothetical protein
MVSGTSVHHIRPEINGFPVSSLKIVVDRALKQLCEKRLKASKVFSIRA